MIDVDYDSYDNDDDNDDEILVMGIHIMIIYIYMDIIGWDGETIDRKIAIELNNGRAAMMGIFALVIHEKLDNNPYIINSLLGYPVPFNQ